MILKGCKENCNAQSISNHMVHLNDQKRAVISEVWHEPDLPLKAVLWELELVLVFDEITKLVHWVNTTYCFEGIFKLTDQLKPTDLLKVVLVEHFYDWWAKSYLFLRHFFKENFSHRYLRAPLQNYCPHHPASIFFSVIPGSLVSGAHLLQTILHSNVPV